MSLIKVVIRGEIIAECQHSRSGGCHSGEAAIETLVPALRTCCYVIPRYCEMHPTVNQIATLGTNFERKASTGDDSVLPGQKQERAYRCQPTE